MDKNEFSSLMGECFKLSETYPDIVYIGGIAVYMHCVNTNEQLVSQLAEFTHDGDFYISIPSMSDLRDAEEVVQNSRLSKHQIKKKGFEFDIYTEHHSSLIAPYSDVAANAVAYNGFRVASLPHLLALKLEAFLDRQGSSKGEKDAKDVIRIALCARHLGFDAGIYCRYSTQDHLNLLEKVLKGPYSIELAMGNHHQAKKIRESVSFLVEAISNHENSLSPKY